MQEVRCVCPSSLMQGLWLCAPIKLPKILLPLHPHFPLPIDPVPDILSTCPPAQEPSLRKAAADEGDIRVLQPVRLSDFLSASSAGQQLLGGGRRRR